MALLAHAWSLILLLLILAGPTSLCLSLLLVNRKETGDRSIVHSFLILVTGWSILQVSLGLLLGALHKLSLYTVLLSEISLFIVGVMIISAYGDYFNVALLRGALRVKTRLSKYEQLIVSSILLVGFINVYKLSVHPIIEFDSLFFHLPAIARWYQTGSLALLDPAGHWIFSHTDATLYPYNWHILSVLFILPFKEDFWVALPMLLAWVILGVAVYLLSRLLQAGRIYALATTSLLLTIPFILDQVNTIHIDLPLAAFFIVSLYFVLSYQKTQASSELALCFASVGMLAGIKTPGIIYGGFLLMILIGTKINSAIEFLVQRSSLFRWKATNLINPLICTSLIFSLYLGGFWYLKNFEEVKNYVAGLNSSLIASTEIIRSPAWSGFYKLQESTLTHQFDLKNIYNWRTLAGQILVRLQLPFLVMLSQVLWLPYCCLTGTKSDRKNFIGILILLLVTGFLYWNTPYSSGTFGEFPGRISPLVGNNFRYGFSFVGMLAIAVAVIATRLQISKKFVVLVVITSSIFGIVGSIGFDAARTEAFAGTKVFWVSRILDGSNAGYGKLIDLARQLLKSSFTYICAYIAFYFSGLLIVYLSLFRKLAYPNVLLKAHRLIHRKRAAYACVCITLIIAMTWTMREYRDSYRNYVYKGVYEYLDTKVRPNEKIGYLLSPRSYLFYGKSFDRQVFNLSALLNDPDQWLDEVQKNQVNLVAIGPLTNRNSLTMDSLLALIKKGSLIKVFGNDFENEPTLYRLKN